MNRRQLDPSAPLDFNFHELTSILRDAPFEPESADDDEQPQLLVVIAAAVDPRTART
jgi:hypothetical protein